ncbi:MAG TPA: F0F1 ATP synthase subunit delta [Patescibacteria group bacterium]
MQVTITTAIELTSAQLQKIKTAVTKKYGTEVTFETKVNPEIVGGILLTIGSQQYDATLQHKLDQIEKSLLTI